MTAETAPGTGATTRNARVPEQAPATGSATVPAQTPATASEQAPGTGREGTPLSLELLVHGVGGTTPQAMLKDPRTVLVTGDDTAGIYRRSGDVDAEKRPQAYHGKPVPEAYSWCNMTSGDGSRALWLLLLPFMVANLAYWMRPATATPAQERLHGALTRLVALSLTVLLVAGAAEVSMDLMAWQCAGRPQCLDDKSWLGFLAGQEPGRRLVAGAVLPVALTALMWWLSHHTWYAYESQRPVTHDGRDGAGKRDPEQEAPLARPGFWYGRRLVARLRALHTAAGLLTVAAALVGPALVADLRAGAALLSAAGWALAALVAALTTTAVVVTATVGRDETTQDAGRDRDRTVSRLLMRGTWAALVLTAGYACWHRSGWDPGGRLPAGTLFGGLMLAQLLLVVGLGAVAQAMHRPGPGDRVAMNGFGGPAVALLGCALGGVLTGGIAQRVADWLDRGGTPGEGGAILGPPVLLSWQASVIPVLLLALAVSLAVGARGLARRTRALEAQVRADYPAGPHEPARTREIAAARARAGLTDRAPVLVAVIGAVSLVLAAGALAGAWICRAVPGKAADPAPWLISPAADAAQAVGSWLIGAGVIALVTLGRRAYRDTRARRTVGILWDVGTFWPRAAHPFAPPCYAERAVPDLTWRMTTWTRTHGGRIILSGHSQGSVLSAAAVWQLDPHTRRKVALLTYGSPLERLYGRWFPAYFGPQALRDLHGELRAWRNLWRATDPIGGPVGCERAEGDTQVDAPAFTDPLAYGRDDAHPLPEPVLAHSDYQADPRFAAERAGLLDLLSAAEQPAGQPAEQPAAQPAEQPDEPRRLPAQGSAGKSSG